MPPRSRRPRVAGLRRPGGPADEETTETTTTESSPGRTATLAEERADSDGAAVTTAPTDSPAPSAAPASSAAAPEAAPAPSAAPASSAAASSAAASSAAASSAAAAPAPASSAPAPASADQLADRPDVDRDPQDQRPVDHGSGLAEAPEEAPAEAPADATAEVATPAAEPPVEDATAEVATAPADAPTTRIDTEKARPTPTGRAGRAQAPTRRRPAPSTGAASTASTVGAASTASTADTVTTEKVDAGQPGRLRRATRSAGEPVRRLAASRRALVAVLVVVTVVCLVLAGLAFWRGAVARTSGPLANGAVVDSATTAELVGQTRQAVEQVFSYDFAKLDDSLDAARTLGTGDFPGQYQQIFDQAIREPATQQKLRQTATVLNIGVQDIDGDDASVMALVQFHAERTSTGQSTDAPGLLSLRMQRVDGLWKLAQLRPLTPAP